MDSILIEPKSLPLLPLSQEENLEIENFFFNNKEEIKEFIMYDFDLDLEFFDNFFTKIIEISKKHKQIKKYFELFKHDDEEKIIFYSNLCIKNHIFTLEWDL